ncbi:hypothetical protein BJF79_45900 [Actinomadura sp. CNU-125]|uniref:hypothetical protein n=1 Tax=Actinomadura sp. CNU-125 TaxID=1904961 RepID=UPI00095E8229|nr:hypothetical protein [Actinomadura sp. CNU-125]OLT23626.1 hypothetical protein BJF79_45900 [Actinomadura sp. CNU-125]
MTGLSEVNVCPCVPAFSWDGSFCPVKVVGSGSGASWPIHSPPRSRPSSRPVSHHVGSLHFEARPSASQTRTVQW